MESTRRRSLKRLCSIISKVPIEGAYLFGSWPRSSDPHDFDLLLVYDRRLCSQEQMIALRRKIRMSAPEIFGLPAHVVSLTIEEEEEVQFIQAEQCVRLECS
jgi:predicted nucleotidyltransferase